jgi:multisubunit Na+/H+ antiporter MnhB subunit
VAAFRVGTNSADGSFQVGVAVALGIAVLIMGVALALAVREFRTRKTCSVDENLSHRSVISSQ